MSTGERTAGEEAADPTELRFRLLGRMAVLVHGDWRDDWPRPAARRLLALLVLSPGHRMGREVVADHLFSHLPPDRALRSVSKALSQARTVVGSDCLCADPANIWIAKERAVVSDFDETTRILRQAQGAAPPRTQHASLRRAVSRSGDLLTEDVYEEWAQGPRDRLDGLARTARLALARSSDDPGDWFDLAIHDVGCDEAWCALLNDAARRNDATAVSALFTRHRRARHSELGLSPSTRVSELYERLRAPAPREQVADVPMVRGRLREMSCLVDAVNDAARGAGSSILLIGPAGIGKSHLLGAVTRRAAAEDRLCAIGACVSDDETVPFAALRAALAAPAWTPPSGSLLRTVLDGGPAVGTGAGPPAAMVARLAEELSAFLDDLDAPALLVIDDIHWADTSLQELVVRLAADPRPRRWSLLLAARSDEPGLPLPPIPSRAQVVNLQPLARADMTDLARDLVAKNPGLDPPAEAALIELLVRRSAGNPFFLTELVRAGADTGPPEASAGRAVPERIQALLRDRIASCTAPAREALTTVALAGEFASYDLLELATGTGIGIGSTVPELVSELRARFLLEDSHAPRVIHPLLREAVQAVMPALVRSDVHVRIADALEDLASRSGRADLALPSANHRIAAFGCSGTVELAARAAEAAIPAGGLALRMFATEPASRILAKGLAAYDAASEVDRARLGAVAFRGSLDLGNCQQALGRVDEAHASYQRAQALAGSAEELARCTRALAGLPYRQGRMVESMEVLQAGLQQIDPDEAFARSLVELEIAWIHHRTGGVSEAQPLLERVVETLEEGGDWSLAARSLDRLAMNLSGLRRHTEALDALDRAAAANAKTGGEHQRGVLLIHRGGVLSSLGRYDEALEAVTWGRELLERSHDDYTTSVSHWTAADIHERRGDPESALASRDREVALLTSIGNQFNLASAQAHRALLLDLLGQPEEAARAALLARSAAAACDDSELAARIEMRLNSGNTTGTART